MVGGWWSLAFVGFAKLVVAGFVGFVLQFFLLLGIREKEERRLRRGVREWTEGM